MCVCVCVCVCLLWFVGLGCCLWWQPQQQGLEEQMNLPASALFCPRHWQWRQHISQHNTLFTMTERGERWRERAGRSIIESGIILNKEGGKQRELAVMEREREEREERDIYIAMETEGNITWESNASLLLHEYHCRSVQISSSVPTWGMQGHTEPHSSSSSCSCGCRGSALDSSPTTSL